MNDKDIRYIIKKRSYLKVVAYIQTLVKRVVRKYKNRLNSTIVELSLFYFNYYLEKNLYEAFSINKNS
ncbi:hypothetical protein FCV41_03145 [Clostridium argentinense]|uniref:hypothetical protein n=1 Tax=Clostridium argentinense TaxID=29341 RepID=UPI0013F7D778|nr:hypothetical protein [Clostridium argentinense]NFF38459.1 hypothetical protein [Clostridium argentinense]